MSFDDLRERIREEIILHEGNVAAWEWQQKGLLGEAQQLGLSSDEFNRLVNYVSNHVAPDFGRLSDLKLEIKERCDTGQPLLPDELDDFVRKAERMQLSRSFVLDKWLPGITQNLPKTGKPIASSAVNRSPATRPIPEPPVSRSVDRLKSEDSPRQQAAHSPVFVDRKIDQNWALSIITIIGLMFAYGVYKTIIKPDDSTVQQATVDITPVSPVEKPTSANDQTPAGASEGLTVVSETLEDEIGQGEYLDKPAQPAKNQDFDQIDKSQVGQFGEYRASKNGRWGLWRDGSWLIEPEYADIDVYENGRAWVRNNGAESFLDETGSPITDPDIN